MTFLGKTIIASNEAMQVAAGIYLQKHGNLSGFGAVISPEFHKQPLAELNQ